MCRKHPGILSYPDGSCPQCEVEDRRSAVSYTPGPRQAIHTPPPPQLRWKTSEERKAEPIYSGPVMYFPDALAAIARLCLKANVKHNPGEVMHWARHKSTDQLDCAVRHMLTPQEVDPETGEAELVQAAWRLLAELQLAEEKRLIAAGIRPYSGVTT